MTVTRAPANRNVSTLRSATAPPPITSTSRPSRSRNKGKYRIKGSGRLPSRERTRECRDELRLIIGVHGPGVMRKRAPSRGTVGNTMA